MKEMVTGSVEAAGHPSVCNDALGVALSLVIDELAHGVLIASSQGRLLHANQAARQVLSRRHALALQDGHLQTRDPAQARLLQQALAKAATGRRSLVTLPTAGGWSLSVALVPLRSDGSPAAPIALFLSRPGVCDSLMLCFFARSYGLTNSEEQVLAILCQGYSAPEIAVQLKVAVSTVRSHVRSLCAKTHSNGVRALVGRVAVLPPLGTAVHDPVH
jgi:DNA-binding CsgD family transcriptional regulator